MPTDPEAFYRELLHLASTFPNDLAKYPLSFPNRQWLGRVAAMVEESGNLYDTATFTVACNNLGSSMGVSSQMSEITSVLYRALARAERAAPQSVSDAFIPAGETFSAQVAVNKAIGAASLSVLFVDPYAGREVLEQFAAIVPEGVAIKVLADEASAKPTLAPAASAWSKQYGVRRPLEVRTAESRTLHDRLMIVDNSTVWVLGQSFNALAARAHTSIIRVDAGTASL